MKRRSLVTLLSTALILTLLTVPVSSVAKTKKKVFNWNWQTYASPATDMFKLWQAEFAKLSVMTNGRLNITLHPGNAIVPDPTIFDAIADGVLQGTTGTMAYLKGKNPGYATIMQTMTGLFTEGWELGHWYFNYGGLKLVNDALAKVGCIQIWVNQPGAPVEPILCTSSLAHPSDFKGKKIRSLPGPSTDMLRALGATVLPIPGAELYTSLDTGVIDGCEFVGFKENWDVGLHEVIKYALWPSPHNIVCQRAVIVGLDAWNSLPDDLKTALRAACAEYDRYDFYSELGTSEVYLKKMKDYGIIIQTWTDEEWDEVNALGRQLAEEWKKQSPLAKKIIESQIAMLKELGRW